MTEMETPQPEPIPGQPVEPLPEPVEPTAPGEEPDPEVPGEEEVPDSDTMGSDDAAADETVDDAESETYPSGDAPPEAPDGE